MSRAPTRSKEHNPSILTCPWPLKVTLTLARTLHLRGDKTSFLLFFFFFLSLTGSQLHPHLFTLGNPMLQILIYSCQKNPMLQTLTLGHKPLSLTPNHPLKRKQNLVSLILLFFPSFSLTHKSN